MFLSNPLSALAAGWTERGQYMVRCAGGARTATCSLVAICAPGALLAAWLLLPSAMVMSTLTGVQLFAPAQALAATSNAATPNTTSPNTADFLATRAEGLFHRNQMGKAITAYNKVLALNPDHVQALRRRAQINDILGRTDLMLGDLDRAVTLAPDDQLLRAVRANARMKLKMFDGAIMDMTIVLRANPFDLQARRQRAAAYYFSGKKLDALSDLNKLLEMFHGQPRFILSVSDRAALLLLRATILGKLARVDEAADDVLLSIRLGGRRVILRMQVYLRAHGFPDLALSGSSSGELRAAIRSCFSQNKCRQIASRNL